MIKVLLNAYTEFPSPHQGGPNKVIYEILSSIDRNIFEPYYLSKHLYALINKDTGLEEFVREKLSFKKKSAVNLSLLSSTYKKIVSNPLYLWYHFNQTNKFFERFNLTGLNFDVLHSHDVKSFYYLHKKLKCKKVLTIHSKGPQIDDLKDYFGSSSILKNILNNFDKIENESLAAADLITFPSHSALELFASKKIPSEKCKVIYNGINVGLIESINSGISFSSVFGKDSNGYLKLINVADHIAPKNFTLLLEVVHKLINELNQKVQLINIGTGPLTSQYNFMINEFNIQNNVRLVGRAKQSDVITLLKDADYLLHPSERVIFDYIILEALACGTTVIASNAGGNKEIIREKINGYLLKELNSESIYQRLNSSPKLDSKTIKQSLENFSNTKMISEYQNIYTQL